jgi:membrane protein
VFAQQVASDVLAPLVDGLLDEERGGFALGALLVTLYLASRVFRAAVRALDDAYRVASRQGVVTQYLLGFAFTVGALVTLVTVLLLVVIGPLLGDGDAWAERLGLGDAFRAAWSVLRWPTVLALTVAFLTLLYRYAPNVRTTWRRCLPGAVVGTLGALLVSAGFVLYVAAAVPETPGADAGSAAVVQAAAQMLGLVLAAALWIWLSSIAVLLGGVLNAEVDAARDRARPAGLSTPRR